MENHDPFNGNWLSFTPATKPTELSSCFGFLSKYLGTALFFNLKQDRDDLALNLPAKSRAQFFAQAHRWAKSTRSSPTSAMPGTSETLAQQENNSSICKRIRCRRETILFSSNCSFLSYIFVQLSHLKAQQMFLITQKCWVGVLVLLNLFALFVVRHC